MNESNSLRLRGKISQLSWSSNLEKKKVNDHLKNLFRGKLDLLINPLDIEQHRTQMKPKNFTHQNTIYKQEKNNEEESRSGKILLGASGAAVPATVVVDGRRQEEGTGQSDGVSASRR